MGELRGSYGEGGDNPHETGPPDTSAEPVEQTAPPPPEATMSRDEYRQAMQDYLDQQRAEQTTDGDQGERADQAPDQEQTHEDRDESKERPGPAGTEQDRQNPEATETDQNGRSERTSEAEPEPRSDDPRDEASDDEPARVESPHEAADSPQQAGDQPAEQPDTVHEETRSQQGYRDALREPDPDDYNDPAWNHRAEPTDHPGSRESHAAAEADSPDLGPDQHPEDSAATQAEKPQATADEPPRETMTREEYRQAMQDYLDQQRVQETAEPQEVSDPDPLDNEAAGQELAINEEQALERSEDSTFDSDALSRDLDPVGASARDKGLPGETGEPLEAEGSGDKALEEDDRGRSRIERFNREFFRKGGDALGGVKDLTNSADAIWGQLPTGTPETRVPEAPTDVHQPPAGTGDVWTGIVALGIVTAELGRRVKDRLKKRENEP